MGPGGGFEKLARATGFYGAVARAGNLVKHWPRHVTSFRLPGKTGAGPGHRRMTARSQHVEATCSQSGSKSSDHSKHRQGAPCSMPQAHSVWQIGPTCFHNPGAPVHLATNASGRFKPSVVSMHCVAFSVEHCPKQAAPDSKGAIQMWSLQVKTRSKSQRAAPSSGHSSGKGEQRAVRSDWTQCAASTPASEQSLAGTGKLSPASHLASTFPTQTASTSSTQRGAPNTQRASSAPSSQIMPSVAQDVVTMPL